MLRQLNVKILGKPTENSYSQIIKNLLNRKYARVTRTLPKLSLKKGPSVNKLPTIDKYLIEDEKIFASKIVSSVEDPNLLKDIFFEHKKDFSGLDIEKILFKYLVGKNGSGIFDYGDIKEENFTQEDRQFLKVLIDDWINKLDKVDDVEFNMMVKMITLAECVSSEQGLRILKFCREKHIPVSFYIAPILIDHLMAIDENDVDKNLEFLCKNIAIQISVNFVNSKDLLMRVKLLAASLKTKKSEIFVVETLE